jgi:beta-fructofuranosidase
MASTEATRAGATTMRSVSRRPGGVFYQPADAWLGDVIPFFHDGWFWLFYLHDRRDGAGGRGTPWYLVRTRDLVEFEEFGEALPSGGPGAPDFNAYTGSVLEASDGFHLFYTGQNPAIRDPASGEPVQVVMHATSTDLLDWRKLPEDTLAAPRGQHEPQDWRDPFVYWDARRERFVMLLAARTVDGPGRRRGCIARCTSSDLRHWHVEEPLWSPGLYITNECPEVFREGDRWFLTFSEFSDRFVSAYRVGATSDGPWQAPAPDDSLDGRAYYAPRTASDGQHRYAFGWVATKEGERDDGAWQWAGNLAIHELTARRDGSLGVSLPIPIRDSFDEAVGSDPKALVGDWLIRPDGATGHAAGTHGLARMGPMPDPCLISATVRFSADTRACGLALRMGDDPDEAYLIRLEPDRGRLVFDRWPRQRTGPMQWQVGGDVPHAVELERVVRLDPDATHRLEVVVDRSICVTYLDGSVAMSARMYDRPRGDWGLFATEGSVGFTDLSIRTRRPAPAGGASAPRKEEWP